MSLSDSRVDSLVVDLIATVTRGTRNIFRSGWHLCVNAMLIIALLQINQISSKQIILN